MSPRVVLAALLVAAVSASARAAAPLPLSVRHEGHDHSADAAANSTTAVNSTAAANSTTTATAAASSTTTAANKTTTSNGTTTTNGTKSNNSSNGSSGSGANTSSSCFPAGATVTTLDGAVKRMDELVAGDRVHVGRGQFSEIFMFTHKSPDVSAEFVVLEAAASGARLALTPGHYLYVNGGLADAKTVVVGDAIELADGSFDTVASVSSTVLKGLYNPQTLQGDIVVDGIRSSTYTTAVEPVVAHAILSPLRAAYRALGFTSAFFNDGSDMASLLPTGNPTY